jgi:hypothetical protein
MMGIKLVFVFVFFGPVYYFLYAFHYTEESFIVCLYQYCLWRSIYKRVQKLDHTFTFSEDDNCIICCGNIMFDMIDCDLTLISVTTYI